MKKILTSITLLSSICAHSIADENYNNQASSSLNGRYVLEQISDFRSDKFLLDTQSGRVWQIVRDEDDHYIFQPVPFIQLLGQRAHLPETLENDVSWQEAINIEAAKRFGKSLAEDE